MATRSQRRARLRKRLSKQGRLIGGSNEMRPELADLVPPESEQGRYQDAMVRRLPGSFESGKRP
jgi:hypothetical protein